MRIRHKILLGYVALIAVVVVLVIFFLVTLSDINRRYADLINRDQQVLIHANNLLSAVQRQIVAARTYEQIADDSLKLEYNYHARQQQAAIKAIDPWLTDESDRNAMQQIEEASHSYTQLAQETMQLSHQPDADTTLLTLKRLQGETVRLKLVSAIEHFITNRNGKLGEKQAAVSAKSRRHQRSFWYGRWSA